MCVIEDILIVNTFQSVLIIKSYDIQWQKCIRIHTYVTVLPCLTTCFHAADYTHLLSPALIMPPVQYTPAPHFPSARLCLVTQSSVSFGFGQPAFTLSSAHVSLLPLLSELEELT